MSNEQNNLEKRLDLYQRGVITASEFNVLQVLENRFSVITKIPSKARKDLNDAVKKGVLGHIKKDGISPEVYYNPKFKHLATEAISKELSKTALAIKGVCV
jgi:hypothetical protein